MECPSCGQTLNRFDEDCPRCDPPAEHGVAGLYEEDLLDGTRHAPPPEPKKLSTDAKLAIIVGTIVFFGLLVIGSHFAVLVHNRYEAVNARDSAGNTSLMSAVSSGNADTAKILISAGANVNAATKDNVTVLMDAVIKGNTDCVKLLIAAGADVNASTTNGVTALMLARSKDVSDLLLRAGESR
ncbi:MAG: ankyrin repeat domain-containing protein [Capsulimonadaceae bacterium]|nr:ankyrin repeat domain-containing protein [Capsulimonadaceae bacterium]